MDEGGEKENEVRADLRPERRAKLQFRGVVAHPKVLERRNGHARGIYNRLVADNRYSGKQISGEVQRRLNTLISGAGYSAYQLVFGSNPVELFG